MVGLDPGTHNNYYGKLRKSKAIGNIERDVVGEMLSLGASGLFVFVPISKYPDYN